VGKIIREILALLWKVVRQVLWEKLKKLLRTVVVRGLIYLLVIAAIVGVIIAIASRF
jgi:hypothetical protein